MKRHDVASWIPDPPTASDLEAWGLEPAWSRTIDIESHDGTNRRWHLLDSAPTNPLATVVCVHGNPTWAYSWATFLRRFGDNFRVIAIDQLGMGFSERTGLRRYAARVRDPHDNLMAEGGRYHVRGQLPGYLQRLRETDRESLARQLEQKWSA